jgi:hypothetical protein
MDSIRKSFALILILIMAISSLMIVKPAFAQTPKPSVPEFTLKFVAHPYDVAPTTTIDPYTGKIVTTQAGYHVENRSIELVIKNQHFTPYKDANGNNIVLSYNVSVKGHYVDDWKYYPDAYWKIPLMPSNGDYSVISFGSGYNESDPYSYLMDIPDSGQIDFRVEQRIGYYVEKQVYYSIPGGPFYNVTFTGQTSGWSNTQTITISDGSTSTSTSPNPTSSSNSTTASTSTPTATDSTGNSISAPLSTFIAVAGVFAVIIVSLLLLLYRRHRKTHE